MKISIITQLRGKFILYQNRIHEVTDVHLSGSVYVLSTDLQRIDVLKFEEDQFISSILAARERSELVDYEREAPSESNIVNVHNVSLNKSIPGFIKISSDQNDSVVTSDQVAIVGSEESSSMTVLPATGFHKAPFETTLQKHGAEMSNILMDTMRKLKAGVIKKDQVEGICAVARELSNQAKDEINLIRTLKH